MSDLGAPGWEALARTELGRVTPGGSAHPDLTATEVRIVGLVAAGGTNREVAASSYMAVSTVEAHLTRVYRKLGIRSRTQLTRLVADGVVDVSTGDGGKGGREVEGGV